VDAGCAAGQQFTALANSVLDAQTLDRFAVVAVRVEQLVQIARDRRAAALGETFDLVEVGYRHDAGHDRHRDAGLACRVHESEIRAVVEEQLGDQEIDPGIDLLAKMHQVGLEGWRLDVLFGVTSRGDAERPRLRSDELDEFGREAKALRVRHEAFFADRRVTAQCDEVLYAGVLQTIEKRDQFVASGSHAGQVGHRFDADLVLDVGDQFDRALPGAAAGAVRDRDEIWRERA